jgi:hypothetical protein
MKPWGEVSSFPDANTLFQEQQINGRTENPNVRAIGQGEPRHRKYKRLKLGGGQAYDRSSV